MKWIICLVFVLCGSVGVFAQAAGNVEGEFLNALDKAGNLNWFLQPSPYRTIHTGEVVLKFKKENLERPLSSYRTVLEIDRKIGVHAVHEVSKNAVKGKYEFFEIHGKYLERTDEGGWRQVERLSKNIAGNLALPNSREYKNIKESSETNRTSIEYKYLGKEPVSNQTADVYMTIEKGADGETAGKNARTQTRKFWFAQNGKILKLDAEIIIENDGGESRSHYTQSWEADENIKIEAPKFPAAR